MKVLRLTDARGGAAANLPGRANSCGRWDVTAASLDTDFAFVGTDPYNTSTFAGLVVPATPSANIAGAQRYLFLLARAQFEIGQKGVKLVGIRQYADLVARVTPTSGPTAVFHREITTPMFHPPDGAISWHVMVLDKTWRDTRNPSNSDSVVFQDAYSPALLYQTLAPYTPPNGGMPWGTPLDSSLGNIHELRYPYRQARDEVSLRIPIPVPCDIAFYASVRQNDPATNPSAATLGLSANQFSSLSPEEQFLTAFPTLAQYGRIGGSLIFEGDST